MKKILFLYTLIFTFSLATSCGSDKKNTVENDAPAIKVKVEQVSTNGNNPFLAVSGKVQAVNSSNLSTRMMGYVNKIYVKVGDKVKKGQLLLSVNNTDLSAKLAQVNAKVTEAEAAFNNAEKDYNRYKNLFNENSASQKELDDITANYNMSKARLKAANEMKKEVQAQFSYANIRAPFSGVVSNKFINEGDMANPGMPLIEVESPGKFQVMAMVPETEISQIKNGAKVAVQIKSLNQTVNGEVTEVSSSAKNTGGQYLVKILLEKSDVKLLSGMFATVQFPVEKSNLSSTVLIPISALVNKGELSGVYTVSQTNTAILRWLRLGRTQGDKVEVLSGLNANESYIIDSDAKLFNGAKVTVQ
ncbi:efflux transporter periplasmic adaptor subunit [Seonamhaeicola sp. S2-3]|uniref:efflux RND transporter periplasmic adaptor subunit n=1 Tax=Seonamhaeicola sp. S2-3 TaxID=1936081 RepID=UPI0009727A9A|nr:efflux RND transporter periplasmic adaptor subunit [Seonamhaeicola sp. S2-3]APY12741.1 efflux transporter periplasmic adaptor subunit [Seonamhaeicola sp. S2-3]